MDLLKLLRDEEQKTQNDWQDYRRQFERWQVRRVLTAASRTLPVETNCGDVNCLRRIVRR